MLDQWITLTLTKVKNIGVVCNDNSNGIEQRAGKWEEYDGVEQLNNGWSKEKVENLGKSF